MKIRKLPPVKYLDECFLYEPLTGKLFWRNRPRKHFRTTATFKMWNGRWASKEAFHTGKRGYRTGSLDSSYCAAHRVIYKIMLRKEPPPVLDHRDRNTGNNRWKNIRPATKPQNGVNRAVLAANACGHTGVHKHKNKNRWVAQLGVLRGKRYLGIFDSKEKAARVRNAAAKKHYGEFVS